MGLGRLVRRGGVYATAPANVVRGSMGTTKLRAAVSARSVAGRKDPPAAQPRCRVRLSRGDKKV